MSDLRDLIEKILKNEVISAEFNWTNRFADIYDLYNFH